MKKEYRKGKLTVTWEPDKCAHSSICWKGLIAVFNPKVKPWINMEGASEKEIEDQVRKCPSGALGIK